MNKYREDFYVNPMEKIRFHPIHCYVPSSITLKDTRDFRFELDTSTFPALLVVAPDSLIDLFFRRASWPVSSGVISIESGK